MRRRGRALRRPGRLRTERALSPVVGKSLELGVVVLFVAVLSASFYGGIVPEYRTTAAAEAGDRALVGGAERVERAVPERPGRIERRVAVSLPATLRGDPYRIRAASDPEANATALVLDHPDVGVGGRVRLSFPTRGANVTGTWESASDSWVVVRGGSERVSVSLENGRGDSDGRDGGRS
ncbi:hypothetical protein NDI76_04035 [Halogeometricum sp. S1BR25-6]|uniref:Uncharacterized protein n=1 Tax=Halogeometricum salsisoli TaxID=2950536 RepID=A0ABU2GAQ3_9EURY|nr:hypothetical protein [Halogeometricum sp. S1BR25-6]MDS0297902.1 hypothetical protein [Halogeometricum sp. S1BR25-6]